MYFFNYRSTTGMIGRFEKEEQLNLDSIKLNKQ